MEGSAFNGLQTIVYRKQAKDDMEDIVYAYLLKYKDKDGNRDKDVYLRLFPAKAEFKVYPETFSLSDRLNSISLIPTRPELLFPH